MDTFGTWLWHNQDRSQDFKKLYDYSLKIKGLWPINSLRISEYNQSIPASFTTEDKLEMSNLITNIWDLYLTENRNSTIKPEGWIKTNIQTLAVIGIGCITIVLILPILFNLGGLSNEVNTRGILAYIICITTIGSALTVLFGTYLTSGISQELGEKFQRGKDVFTLLIGIFGTILGFYFGSAVNKQDAEQKPAVAAIQRTVEPKAEAQRVDRAIQPYNPEQKPSPKP